VYRVLETQIFTLIKKGSGVRNEVAAKGEGMETDITTAYSIISHKQNPIFHSKCRIDEVLMKRGSTINY
jgi:hypothetical protein